MVVSDLFLKNPSPVYRDVCFIMKHSLRSRGSRLGPATAFSCLLHLGQLLRLSSACPHSPRAPATASVTPTWATLTRTARKPGSAPAVSAQKHQEGKGRALAATGQSLERTNVSKSTQPRRSPLEVLRTPSHLPEAFSRPAVIGRPFPGRLSTAAQLVRANGSPCRSRS